jgi:hypothetical protein
LKQVVLPAPFGPISAWMWPRRTLRLTSWTATKPANSFVSPRVSRMNSPLNQTSPCNLRASGPQGTNAAYAPMGRFCRRPRRAEYALKIKCTASRIDGINLCFGWRPTKPKVADLSHQAKTHDCEELRPRDCTRLARLRGNRLTPFQYSSAKVLGKRHKSKVRTYRTASPE